VGFCWAALAWCGLGCWWATPRQVSPGKAPFLLFSVYLFSVFYFIDSNSVGIQSCFVYFYCLNPCVIQSIFYKNYGCVFYTLIWALKHWSISYYLTLN
jgi:hypothetical protein